MSATATATNGRPTRKQLSDQLDRLDEILGVLAEALPAAVADACREGARHAVRDAVVELLTSPEFRTLLDALRAAPTPTALVPPPPEPDRGPGPWARLKAGIAAARARMSGAVSRAKEALAARFRALAEAGPALTAFAGEPFPWCRVLAVGAGIGLVVGVACLVAPHAVAAAVGALGAGAASVAGQLAHWLKRGARRLGLI